MEVSDIYRFLNWAEYIQHQPMILYLSNDFFVKRSPALPMMQAVNDIGKFTTFKTAFKYIRMTYINYYDLDDHDGDHTMRVRITTCSDLSSDLAISGCKHFRKMLEMQPQQQIFNFQAQQVHNSMEWIYASHVVPNDTIFLHKLKYDDPETDESKRCLVLQTSDYYITLYENGVDVFNFDHFKYAKNARIPTLTQSGESWQREFNINNDYIGANPDVFMTFAVYNAIRFETFATADHYDVNKLRIIDLNQLPRTIVFFGKHPYRKFRLEAKLNFNIFYPAFADRLKNLQYLHVRKMWLNGGVDAARLPPNLMQLVLDENELYGTVDWCNLPNTLKYMSVSQNRLKGEIDLNCCTCFPESLRESLILGNDLKFIK